MEYTDIVKRIEKLLAKHRKTMRNAAYLIENDLEHQKYVERVATAAIRADYYELTTLLEEFLIGDQLVYKEVEDGKR